MKLYGGLIAEALEKVAEALGDAFELKPAKDGMREASDKSRAGQARVPNASKFLVWLLMATPVIPGALEPCGSDQ